MRKNENRIKLIDACLKAKPNNYKSYQKLLQLAQALRIYGDNRVKREGEVGDSSFCFKILNLNNQEKSNYLI